MKKIVGKWKVEVTGPYPCWIKIEFGDSQEIAGIHHTDLRDLQFAVESAIRAAQVKISPDGPEQV